MSAREHFDDERLERLQLRIQGLEKFIASCPFIGGKVVRAQALTTASLQIAHGLGRAPKGMYAISVTPDAAVGLSVAQSIDPVKFANVEASATCTADLWFY